MDMDSLKLEALHLRQRMQRIVQRRGINESHIAIRAVAILGARYRIIQAKIERGNK